MKSKAHGVTAANVRRPASKSKSKLSELNMAKLHRGTAPGSVIEPSGRSIKTHKIDRPFGLPTPAQSNASQRHSK